LHILERHAADSWRCVQFCQLISKLQYRYGRSAEQSAHKHPHASYTNCHRKVTPDMLLGRIAMSRVRCGLRCDVICMCLLVATVSCAKTAEPIEMPFGMLTRGAEEPCIRWGSDLSTRRGTLGCVDSPAVDICNRICYGPGAMRSPATSQA